MATRSNPTEPNIDPAALYLEEVFTDRRVGTIRRMTPVKGDGARDPAREITYVGETQVMSTVGALPIVFEIEATSLEDAAVKFGPLAKEAIERTVRELQDLSRRIWESALRRVYTLATDRIETDQRRGGEQAMRMRFGVFFYSEPDSPLTRDTDLPIADGKDLP